MRIAGDGAIDMKDFASLQSQFQHAILDGDVQVLADLLDGPRQGRAALFDVYRSAYVSRLVEALGKSYEALLRYMGHEMFDEMGRTYVAGAPSTHPNMRWYGGTLPTFLAATCPYADHPILTDLATLERALNDAFDAPDAPVLALADLAGVDPLRWQDLVFTSHPSATRADLATNALTVWSALRADEEVPAAEASDGVERVLVWRDDATSMVRTLGAEEAMMWDEAAHGIAFGQLCAMLAICDRPETAAERAAGYLGGWIQAGLMAGYRQA